MRIATSCTAFLLCHAALAATSQAQSTLLVPETFATIQAAMDAALDGDTVSVAPGIYVGALTFPDKEILVQSRRGPAETLIQPRTGPPLATVRFAAGAGRASILDGFTVRYGEPGVVIVDSSPTVRNCILRHNGNFRIGEDGAGLHCRGGAPLIQNCIVQENVADFDGPGMWFQDITGDWALVVNCVVYGNISFSGDWFGSLSTMNARVLVANTIVRENDELTYDLGVSPPAFVINSNWRTGNSHNGSNGNINADPLWVDAGAGFHLRAASPCREAGTRLLPNLPGLGGLPLTDIEGDPRWVGPTPDMGVDEYTPHLAHVGSLSGPGANVQFRLFGVPPGEPCQGWMSTSRSDPPIPTPFGPFHLGDRHIQLFGAQPMPASESIQASFILPLGSPGLDELFAQALGGERFSNLDVVAVE